MSSRSNRPVVGDPMRQWGNGEHKVWWEVIGRNKRSVTANLRVPEGQELARRLLADADIMIENFKPGTIEKWGLGPASAPCPQPAAHHVSG
jgi:crotonobetainyl-CoA:carnitine CoA-transferase CaiB-like acyl-CoA transferase